jgi:hypothetical protein
MKAPKERLRLREREDGPSDGPSATDVRETGTVELVESSGQARGQA